MHTFVSISISLNLGQFHTNPKYHVVWLARLKNCMNVFFHGLERSLTSVQNITIVRYETDLKGGHRVEVH